MTKQTVYQLIKASLFTDDNLEIPDYHPIFDEMKEQAVATLPGEWLESHLTSAVSWISYCSAQQGLWLRIMHEQDEIITLLEDHHIPCVVIKGSAAAMYYPYPYLRTMGDVDILIKRDDVSKAEKIIEENGYLLSQDKDPADDQYHYFKDDVSFELHKRLPVIDCQNEKLLLLFEKGIDKREWHEIEEFRFPTLPLYLNGLVIIFHINQHLREGLGLRQIVDWMMFVHTTSDSDWESLIPLLKETGMEQLALTTTAMCKKYLGLEETIPGYNYVDTEACDALMSFIMEKGNFGRKAGIAGKTVAFSLSSKDKKSFFKRLQIGGLDRWKTAKKYPILQPFAWIYQSFRILKILITDGIGLKAIYLQRQKGIKQRELLTMLGLSIDRTVHADLDKTEEPS